MCTGGENNFCLVQDSFLTQDVVETTREIVYYIYSLPSNINYMIMLKSE